MKRTNTKATVFNYYKSNDTESWNKTVLDSVHWEQNKISSVTSSGLAFADYNEILIWFDVDAEGKTYIDPVAYSKLSEDEVGSYWTLCTGKDRMLKGITDTTSISEVTKLDGCITIKSVDKMDYGSGKKQHFEVGGT